MADFRHTKDMSGDYVQYYVSKNHNRLNRRAFSPETITPRLCLSPKYPITLARSPAEMDIILDSGAFQDISHEERLTFQTALSRQLEFEKRVGFTSNYIVSYDHIVDECPTVRGKRKKHRVSFSTAERYVDETIDAAKFLADCRKELEPRRLILSNQGVTPSQYVECVKEILKFSEPVDVIGLGGFCIIGQVPRLINDYFKVIEETLPLLETRKIRRLHIFGVGVFKVLIRTHVLCHRHNVIPSYDTSSMEFNAIFGRAFSPDIMRIGPPGVHLTQVFKRDDKYELYHPRDWAMLNIRMVHMFWDELEKIYPISGREEQ